MGGLFGGEAEASSYEQAKDFVDANRTETL